MTILFNLSFPTKLSSIVVVHLKSSLKPQHSSTSPLNQRTRHWQGTCLLKCVPQKFTFFSASRFKDRHANTQKTFIKFCVLFFVLACLLCYRKTSAQCSISSLSSSQSITLDFFNLKSHQTWREKNSIEVFLLICLRIFFSSFFLCNDHIKRHIQKRKVVKYTFCYKCVRQMTWCGYKR